VALALQARDLRVVYGDAIAAVHGVDIAVAAATSVAILGANGAGKSSIMKTLAGWHPAAGGAVQLFGADVTRAPPEARARAGLAYIPEGGHIFQRLSVRENLLMGGYLNDRPESEIERACAPFPALSERMDQLAGTLSGGELQMLAIARARMARPRLLLVDEVSIGLMPQAIEQVFQAIRALVADGVAVLMTEQNARQAMAVVDHVYLLENGRVALEGPPDTVARDDRVVAAYLGN
jgi:branched-chain amino acid transport system ATP-binding protein